ncbi:hypothetical protein BDW75DRAFT_234040 [Aspergillus navahoensis]
MKYYGVVYDVGLHFNGEGFSVEPFGPALVEYDVRAISREDIYRLKVAAPAAHSRGINFFLNPWKMKEGIHPTRAYFEEAAKTAEKLRSEGINMAFIAGCEYTIFSKSLALNQVLGSFVEIIRANFRGPLTYSAGSWEVTAEEYVSGLERYRPNKPLAVLEVGCCAYEGAAKRGDGDIIPTRSEKEQADYVLTQLNLLSKANADGVLMDVFLFPLKMIPPWAPKEAFHRVADFFCSLQAPDHTVSALL